MKSTLKRLLPALQILANTILFALLHVKIFHRVAVLPGRDAAGNFMPLQVDHYYSILDFLGKTPFPYIPLFLCLALASVLTSLLAILRKSKRAHLAGHILFALTALGFVLLLWKASATMIVY